MTSGLENTPAGSLPPIYFLMFNGDGSGGVARTVRNLAHHLVGRHRVQIISLLRRRDSPTYPIDPRVEVSYLIDNRGKGEELGEGEQSDTEVFDLIVATLAPKLEGLPPGILVSTRPSLHAAVAQIAPRNLITVAQDHLNFETRSSDEHMISWLKESLLGLDCFVVLTQADARDYSQLLTGADTIVTAIPNAVPWPVASSPAPLDSKIVVAAGRMVAQKGFSRLIEAYAPVARSHPDWQLHIYGKGEERRMLRQLIDQLGIEAQVLLKGRSDEFEQVLANASIYAMSSRFEGFPMVLIEAMSKGVPLVSFDCPRGPGETIVDGENGRLVPEGDVPALSGALRQLIEDDELRARMGAAGLEHARQYDIAVIVARWESLFATLWEQRHARRHDQPRL